MEIRVHLLITFEAHIFFSSCQNAVATIFIWRDLKYFFNDIWYIILKGKSLLASIQFLNWSSTSSSQYLNRSIRPSLWSSSCQFCFYTLVHELGPTRNILHLEKKRKTSITSSLFCLISASSYLQMLRHQFLYTFFFIDYGVHQYAPI